MRPDGGEAAPAYIPGISFELQIHPTITWRAVRPPGDRRIEEVMGMEFTALHRPTQTVGGKYRARSVLNDRSRLP